MSEFRSSDDDASSRTEPPSARRLEEARRAGDVPRSGEVTRWAMLAGVVALLSGFSAAAFTHVADWFAAGLTHVADPFPAVPFAGLIDLIWIVLPLLLVPVVVALVASLLLSGWTFAAPAPRVRRLSWAGPVRRAVSAEAGWDTFRYALKVLVAGSVVALAWEAGLHPVPAGTSAGELPALFVEPLWRALRWLLAALAAVAALDAGWCWWRWWRRHAMTPREVLAEAMEDEASPEARAAMRRRREVVQEAGA